MILYRCLKEYSCDLQNESDILSMFSEINRSFKKLDVCINNAGLGIDAPILNGKTEDWKKMFDVNVMGLGICTREAWKLMNNSNVEDGQFIHINTSYSFGSNVASSSNYYAATKVMVKSLAEAQRREFKDLEKKVRVSQVSPGLVSSEFIARKLNEEAAAKVFDSMPSLKPEDVADSIIHILRAPPHVQIRDIVIDPM